MSERDSLTLGLVLELAVTGGPDRTALSFGDESWTYAELAELAGQWRNHLSAAGHSEVTAIGENHPGMIGLLFGALIAGVNVSVVNPRLKANELIHALEATGSGALYLWNVRSSAPVAAVGGLDPAPALFAMTTAEPPHARVGSSSGQQSPAHSWAGSLHLFTSGTTSLPKAVVLPQHALAEYLFNSYVPGSAELDEANLISAPLFHIAGVMNLLSSLFTLRRIVLMPRFEPLEWLRVARHEGVTQAFLVPSMLKQIVETLRERGADLAPRKLRLIAYGGAPSRPRDLLSALKTFETVDFVGAFGLTETSSTACVLGPEDHREAQHSYHGEEILSSVGRPIPGVEVAIAGAGDSMTTAAGVEGEVVIRGQQVSPGYVNAPSRIDRDGWFHTGDRGAFDQQGRLHLLGRMDDMIQRGAENVSPLEVERAFAAYDGIAEVAAVGVPDETWGEVVMLAVVPDGSIPTEELREGLQGWASSMLAAHKRPVAYLFLAELPRNALGKLVRTKVRELAVQVDPAAVATAGQR